MKISVNQYANTLYDLTKGKEKSSIVDIVQKFIVVLTKNGHLKMSDKIIEKFNDIYNKENGIVEAEITTARNNNQETKNKIEKFIKEKYKAKEVNINNKIDLNIKGGIVVRVKDEILDASVAGKLKSLKSILSK